LSLMKLLSMGRNDCLRSSSLSVLNEWKDKNRQNKYRDPSLRSG